MAARAGTRWFVLAGKFQIRRLRSLWIVTRTGRVMAFHAAFLAIWFVTFGHFHDCKLLNYAHKKSPGSEPGLCFGGLNNNLHNRY